MINKIKYFYVISVSEETLYSTQPSATCFSSHCYFFWNLSLLTHVPSVHLFPFENFITRSYSESSLPCCRDLYAKGK